MELMGEVLIDIDNGIFVKYCWKLIGWNLRLRKFLIDLFLSFLLNKLLVLFVLKGLLMVLDKKIVLLMKEGMLIGKVFGMILFGMGLFGR